MTKIVRLPLFFFILTLQGSLHASVLSNALESTPKPEMSLKVYEDKQFQKLSNEYPNGFNVVNKKGNTVFHTLSRPDYRLKNDTQDNAFDTRFNLCHKILEEIDKEEKKKKKALVKLSKTSPQHFYLSEDIIALICSFSYFSILFHENDLGQTAIEIAKKNEQYTLWAFLETIIRSKEKLGHDVATIDFNFPFPNIMKREIENLAIRRQNNDFFRNFYADMHQ